MKKVKIAVALLLLLAIAAAIGIVLTGEKEPEAVVFRTAEELSGDWDTIPWKEGYAVTYTSSLPEGLAGQERVMMLQSHWKDYEILVDGTEVYAAQGERTGASHLFSLPEGDILTIRFLCDDPSALFSARQARIYAGDKAGIYSMLARDNLYALLFAVVTLFLGAICICTGVYMRSIKSEELHGILVHLGLYILCAGAWVLTDSNILLLFTQRTALVELISFLAFFIMPLPLLEFTRRMLPGRERVLAVMEGLFALMLLVYALHYVMGYLFISAMLAAEHLLMAVSIGLVLFFGFRELRKSGRGTLSRVMMGYSVFCFFGALSLIFFYAKGAFAYSATYILGILGFIVFLVDTAWIAVFEQIRENEKIAVYAKMAYLDVMTELGNRAAFLEETRIDADFPGPIAYIMLDANNLKRVNDGLGHQKGDELIIAVAHCIRRAVRELGSCYRIGGDEFVVRLRNRSLPQVRELIEAIQRELAQAAQHSDLPVSAAVGVAWTDGMPKEPQRLLQQADDAMYEAKKRMKQESAQAAPAAQ